MSVAMLPDKPPSASFRRNQNGVAMLAAIGVIAVLLVVGLALNQRIRTSVGDAIRVRDELVLSEMAASGVHAAMVMLINDARDSRTDTLQEDWARSERVAEMVAVMPFDDGRVEVRITDERGKIQVNALVQFPDGREFSVVQHRLWERLLNTMVATAEDLPDLDSAMILNSVKDWLDRGDDDAITGLTGAESDYYQGLDPPYSAKNGPLDHISELALIQGVPSWLFHGSEQLPGLSSLVTVHGAMPSGTESFTFDGKINISTADKTVLAALLPFENEELAQALADFREARDGDVFINDIRSPTWYQRVPGAAGITLDPDLITVSSDLFSITSTAVLNQWSCTVTAVVQRKKARGTGKPECKVLSWQVN